MQLRLAVLDPVGADDEPDMRTVLDHRRHHHCVDPPVLYRRVDGEQTHDGIHGYAGELGQDDELRAGRKCLVQQSLGLRVVRRADDGREHAVGSRGSDSADRLGGDRVVQLGTP